MGFTAFPIQQKLLGTLRDGRFRFIGFGGAIRGTKTWGSLAAVITLCKLFPNSRWAVVRKDLPRLRQNTLPSFNKLRPLFGSFVGEVNQGTWTSTCSNGSQIIFFPESLDIDPDLNRWKGLEVNGFVLEEADEIAERSFIKAMERAGAWIVPDGGIQPPPYILCTFNPTPGWPKRTFYEPWKNGSISAPYAFIPATARDNPAVSPEQWESWKNLPEHEYKRFVEGDWNVLTGRYYDALDARIHLSLKRHDLPAKLPEHWEYWGAFDWGYAHWAVFGVFAKDTDGTTYLLDSWWARRQQDAELAEGCKRLVADLGLTGRLSDIYAGHDVKSKVTARSASGETTQDIFATHGIYISLADIDKANGGRALRRALSVRGTPPRTSFYIIDTTANRKVFDQLSETMPDENDVNKPLKINADDDGRGGDDGADMCRYGIASRVMVPDEPNDFSPHDPDKHPGWKDGKPGHGRNRPDKWKPTAKDDGHWESPGYHMPSTTDYEEFVP